jgi:hypothetical protein
MSNVTHLRVTGPTETGNQEFIFDDRDAPTPSSIEPGIYYIKNSQRSLGGKLHVDIMDSKQTLQITFDVLGNTEFQKVKTAFCVDKPIEHGIEVIYPNLVTGERYFVDDFTFTPMILEDGIHWKDVTVSLVEV